MSKLYIYCFSYERFMSTIWQIYLNYGITLITGNSNKVNYNLTAYNIPSRPVAWHASCWARRGSSALERSTVRCGATPRTAQGTWIRLPDHEGLWDAKAIRHIVFNIHTTKQICDNFLVLVFPCFFFRHASGSSIIGVEWQKSNSTTCHPALLLSGSDCKLFWTCVSFTNRNFQLKEIGNYENI